MSREREIQYSDKYYDDFFEYRHVVLPSHVAAHLPPGRLLSEPEWRQLGVQQSRGWIHYHIHKPEPHILLFRRALTPESAALMQQQEAHRQQLQAQQAAQQQYQKQLQQQQHQFQQQQQQLGWGAVQ